MMARLDGSAERPPPPTMVNSVSIDSKLCRVCGPERGPLPMSAFWRCADSRDGYRTICKKCAYVRWPTSSRKKTKGNVSEEDKKLLFALRDQGLSPTQIARELGRSRQTISGIIYRADPSKKPKPLTHPKSAVPKPDDDHPSKKPRGKIKPGDPLWPVEAAMLSARRGLKLLDERRKRLRAEWSR